MRLIRMPLTLGCTRRVGTRAPNLTCKVHSRHWLIDQCRTTVSYVRTPPDQAKVLLGFWMPGAGRLRPLRISHQRNPRHSTWFLHNTVGHSVSPSAAMGPYP